MASSQILSLRTLLGTGDMFWELDVMVPSQF
jgi:hypothetical protein